MDIQTAFLYGLVEKIIYLAQLTYFSNWFVRVCKLYNTLYGLKELPQIWYKTLSKFFFKFGFWSSNTDLRVFAKKEMIIAIYVDDLLICDVVRIKINKIKEPLKA